MPRGGRHPQGTVGASLRGAGRGQSASCVGTARVRRPRAAPLSPQGPPGACWRAWPDGAAWRPGARGPGMCSAQAPGSCASRTARAASRPPSGPRARASAAPAAPPRGAVRDCAPARRSRRSARPRVSAASQRPPPAALPWPPLTARLPLQAAGYPDSGCSARVRRRPLREAKAAACWPGPPRPRSSPLHPCAVLTPLPRSSYRPLGETEEPRLLSSPAWALQPPSLFLGHFSRNLTPISHAGTHPGFLL